MADLILDSGALIACERNNRRFWTAFARIQKEGNSLILPAPVLAQVWRRSTQVPIARLVNACVIVPMDVTLARRAGELCASTNTSDIVDAMVAAVAGQSAADVATSDPTDIRRLMVAAGATGRILEM